MSKLVLEENAGFTTEESEVNETNPTEAPKEGEEPAIAAPTDEAEKPDETIESSEEETATAVAVMETPQKFTIGDAEYTADEVKALLERGSKVKEWEEKMPGFSIDTLMPDYTRKSTELAALKRRVMSEPKPQAGESEELPLDEEQLKLLERAARRLGFVRKDDLVQDSIEAQKEMFLQEHPEYLPENDPTNKQWNTLTQEFNLYAWKQHPEMVSTFLRRAHENISKTRTEAMRGKNVKNEITTRQEINRIASLGGGTTSSPPSPRTKLTQEQIRIYLDGGWTMEDLQDLL